MSIQRSQFDMSSPSTVWRATFRATIWLTVLLAALGAIGAPVDFFVSDQPLEVNIGAGDRVANAVLVVLGQSVVLAFLLFAAHVTQLLEEIARASRSIPRVAAPSTLAETRPQAPDIKGSPPPSSNAQAADESDEPDHLWRCPACGARNGMFDTKRCYKCRTGKPAGGS